MYKITQEYKHTSKQVTKESKYASTEVQKKFTSKCVNKYTSTQ